MLISFVLVVGLNGSSFGAAVNWDNESSDNFWKTAINWDTNNVPAIADNAQIVLQEPSHCIIDGTHTGADANFLRVGEDGVPGDLRMTGGTLAVRKNDRVGDND